MVSKQILFIGVTLLCLGAAVLLHFNSTKPQLAPGQAEKARTPAGVQADETSALTAAEPKRKPLLLNDTFEFPFLGQVKAHSKTAPVSITNQEGKETAVPFKIFYRENGQFLRAEYDRPGAKDYSFDRDTMERSYKQRHEVVNGLPESEARIPFDKVLGSLASEELPFGINFNTATKINVTYALYTRSGLPPTPVYIINVFGCHCLTDRIPDSDQGAKRIRYIVDSEGQTWLFDNNL